MSSVGEGLISDVPPDLGGPLSSTCRCLCHRGDEVRITIIRNGMSVTYRGNGQDQDVDASVRHSTNRKAWCCTRAVREYQERAR